MRVAEASTAVIDEVRVLFTLSDTLRTIVAETAGCATVALRVD
jgi:hypothetical protein